MTTISESRRARAPSFSLIVITDGGPRVLERVEAACQCSAPERVAILLRDKQASAGSLLELAQAVRRLTRQRGAQLLISDRVDVALACQADGVQLPEQGLPVAAARELLGPERWLGASRHDLAGVLDAQQRGADYATLSPVFDAPGKAPALGLEAFGAAAQRTSLPLFALGGVTILSVPALVQAGAYGIAVIREVMSAPFPGLAADQLLRAVAFPQPHRSLAPTGAPG